MPNADLAPLRALLDEVSAKLPEVSHRRMFGCDALFANDNIYALVWKEGRIGLRLPDAKLAEQLLAIENAAPWTAGPKRMAHWVLVPTSFHDDLRALAPWVRRAHALAHGGVPLPAAPKKSSARRPRVTAPLEPQKTRGITLPAPPGAAFPSVAVMPPVKVVRQPRDVTATGKRPSFTATTEHPETTAADKRPRTTGNPAPPPPSSPQDVHVDRRVRSTRSGSGTTRSH